METSSKETNEEIVERLKSKVKDEARLTEALARRYDYQQMNA